MSNRNHRHSDSKIQLETWVSIGLAFLCFLFLWIAYAYIALPSFNNDLSDQRLKDYEAHKKYLLHCPVPMDKDKTVHTIAELDTILRYIEKNEEILADRQADLINDIRQETNNVIDKINLWLTFAIGLISVFGIFIPLIIEHRNRKDIKDSIADMKSDYEKIEKKTVDSMKRLKSDFRSYRDKIQKDINKERVSIKNDSDLQKASIRKETSKLARQEYIQRFRSEFMALSLGFDDRVISAQPDRERMLVFLWSKTVESLTFVVDYCREEDINVEDRRLWLMESFVLINSFVCRIKGHIEMRSRDIDNLVDQVRFLLSYLQTDNKSSQYWKFIFQHIDSIMKIISMVRIQG